jgi:hypothetical protein
MIQPMGRAVIVNQADHHRQIVRASESSRLRIATARRHTAPRGRRSVQGAKSVRTEVTVSRLAPSGRPPISSKKSSRPAGLMNGPRACVCAYARIAAKGDRQPSGRETPDER